MELKVSGGDRLPSILVTGASGLVGRHFIESVRNRFHVYAIARRGQLDAGVPVHDNVRWYRCDIGDGKTLTRVLDTIAEETSIDFVFHFAGYYDYDLRDHVEYRRTNVEGTRHLLEAAERLRVRRFVFASSLAASDYSDPQRVLDERTPLDAEFPYARSKREAEALVSEHSARVPCTIARLGAVYSDWCEYAPLYILLNTWLAGGLRARLIAGRGETAIPYIHVADLNCFWLRIAEKHEELGAFDILVASQSGCVSHNELYLAATQGYDEGERAVHLPVWFATLGVFGLRLLGLAVGRPPFERPWMMEYIDRRMRVDARSTQERLGWAIRPRFHVMRRLLFLIENMKRDPKTWERKNLAMTKQAVLEHPGLKIYNAMVDLRQGIVDAHAHYLTIGESRGFYPSYARLDPNELRLRIELLYQMLESSIRLGDHLSILTYANHLARHRFAGGFDREELVGSLEHLADTIENALKRHPGLGELQRRIHFDIGITMQLILDEIDDVWDTLSEGRDRRC